MADAERSNAASDHLAAEYTAHLRQVQLSLFAILEHYEPTCGAQLLCHALLEVTSQALALTLEKQPWAVADFDARLAQLRLHVVTSGQRPQ